MVGRQCMSKVKDRKAWLNIKEAYIQQWILLLLLGRRECWNLKDVFALSCIIEHKRIVEKFERNNSIKNF